MTGRRYYITTLAAWQRYAPRFLHSHWLSLAGDYISDATAPAPPMSSSTSVDDSGLGAEASAGHGPAAPPASSAPRDERILVLIDADEGVHMVLEDDPGYAALPHPLAPVSISDALQSELASHGVPPGVTTFDAAEILAQKHPLLRHRTF